MEKLYALLKNKTTKDAIETEQKDYQYIALSWLYNSISNKKAYLALIIANSIICYQLSSKWEDYWKEFSLDASKYNFEKLWNIIDFFEEFLPNSKWNKRFIDTKLNRLNRLKPFLADFVWSELYYYNDMTKLRDELATTMRQDKSAKTIVFAVKMFSYWARNYFQKLIEFPEQITIPIDSRLEKLFEKYKWDYKDINLFYSDLSKKLKIAPLHLDAIIWVNFDDIINS